MRTVEIVATAQLAAGIPTIVRIVDHGNMQRSSAEEVYPDQVAQMREWLRLQSYPATSRIGPEKRVMQQIEDGFTGGLVRFLTTHPHNFDGPQLVCSKPGCDNVTDNYLMMPAVSTEPSGMVAACVYHQEQMGKLFRAIIRWNEPVKRD